MSELSDEKLRRLKEVYLGECEAEFDVLLRKTQSPIEAMFVGALICLGFERPSQTDFSDVCETLTARHMRGPYTMLFKEGTAALIQQPLSVGDLHIIVDVLLVGADRIVCVEIDGHDYHERTKEQASRDRNRDRVLTSAGFAPIRFTGSEVFASASSAALCAIKLASEDLYNGAWSDGALGL